MAHQGKHPVIFLTLKAVRGTTFETFYETCKGVIAHLFESHEHLLYAENMSKARQARFERLLHKEATEEEYKSCLLFLSELLYAHHGKRVVILLDEYARQEVASNNCIASL